MLASEVIKLQAKLLEWEAPKGLSANLKGYNAGDYIWVTNCIVVARISRSCYMLNVSWCESIKGLTTLPEDVSEVWLTPMYYKHKEVGTCVRFTVGTGGVWVNSQYLKLFSKGSYNFYVDSKAKNLWLTEPDTRNVVGVIAGIRGINIKV